MLGLSSHTRTHMHRQTHTCWHHLNTLCLATMTHAVLTCATTALQEKKKQILSFLSHYCFFLPWRSWKIAGKRMLDSASLCSTCQSHASGTDRESVCGGGQRVWELGKSWDLTYTESVSKMDICIHRQTYILYYWLFSLLHTHTCTHTVRTL